ncbi:MAG TPA: GNAT family N-acetyltransferase [Tahibacter sp.]|nr:GNAT family N-acetyltransferase [Tahibacter sp.]
MKITAVRSGVDAIAALRRQFLQETNCQIRHHALHARGLSDTWLLACDGAEVGYGSLTGDGDARDTVFEFYVLPGWRRATTPLFLELVDAARPARIECQSNEPLLSSMLFEFAHDINAHGMLFCDDVATILPAPAVAFRRRRDDDDAFEHRDGPVGDFVLERKGRVLATGGFREDGNAPFADLYMEVDTGARGGGIGSYLLQELKKQCYLAGRVPAACSDIRNKALQASLEKAGMRRCGFVLRGGVAAPQPI